MIFDNRLIFFQRPAISVLLRTVPSSVTVTVPVTLTLAVRDSVQTLHLMNRGSGGEERPVRLVSTVAHSTVASCFSFLLRTFRLFQEYFLYAERFSALPIICWPFFSSAKHFFYAKRKNFYAKRKNFLCVVYFSALSCTYGLSLRCTSRNRRKMLGTAENKLTIEENMLGRAEKTSTQPKNAWKGRKMPSTAQKCLEEPKGTQQRR